jgi:serine phosphatase RsbU (regulator of sigma subunit)
LSVDSLVTFRISSASALPINGQTVSYRDSLLADFHQTPFTQDYIPAWKELHLQTIEPAKPEVLPNDEKLIAMGEGSTFLKISTGEKIPGSTVTAQIRDSLGRLWIGTDGGLVCHQGLSLLRYTAINGLSNNYITAFASAGQWMAVGTKSGLNLIYSDRMVQVHSRIEPLMQSDEITSLHTAGDGTLLIGCTSGMALIREDKIAFFPFKEGIRLHPYADGKQVYASSGDSLFHVDIYPERISFKYVLNIPKVKISSIQQQDDVTWIGTSDRGLFKFKSARLYRVFSPSKSASGHFICMAALGQELWSGIFNDGVWVLKENIWKRLESESRSMILFPHTMLTDPYRGLTIGAAGGLWKLLPQIQTLKTGSGLQSSIPISVYAENDTLWFGSVGGGLSFRLRDITYHYDFPKEMRAANIIHISKSLHGKLLSSSGGGLILLKPDRAMVLRKYKELQFPNVNDALEDSQGRIWMATSGQGLLCWSDSLLLQFNEKHGLKNKNVYSLFEDSKGRIYAGTNADGLWICHSGNIQRIIPDSVFPDVIYPVIEYQHQIYMGSYGKGLWKSDLSCRTWTKVPGAPESVLSLHHHSSGLFGGTSSGLFHIDERGAHLRLDKKSGLQADDFFPLALTSSKSQLIAGTGDYLSLIDISIHNKVKPLVSGVNFKNRYQTLNTGQKIQWSYDDRSPAFVCGMAPDPFISSEVPVKYRLSGFSDEWQSSPVNGLFQIHNLQEGNYRFEMAIYDFRGNEQFSDPIEFYIQPPFYRTQWAYLIYLILFILTLFIFSSFRNRRLKQRNLLLEATVKERTAEIVRQKEVIEQQKAEVDQQNLLLSEKNHEILESITYAKGLQEAILPTKEWLDHHLSEYFLFYRPKDIVAGDFYWAEQIRDEHGLIWNLVGIADCTGHGVPGAMVSVVCSNALNRAVTEYHCKRTDQILNKVRELVIENFRRSSSEVKDGMDISLLGYSLSGSEVMWSGANNGLWWVSAETGLLNEIKPDKQPVGNYPDPKPFTLHRVPLNKGDMVYLFTDGFGDQFGGPDEKKFKSANLKKLLTANASLSAEEQKNLAEEAFLTWMGPVEQTDDVSLFGIRIH